MAPKEHHLMNCLRRIRYGLVGGGMLLWVGSEVSKAEVSPSVSLSACCLHIRIYNSQVLLQYLACLP